MRSFIGVGTIALLSVVAVVGCVSSSTSTPSPAGDASVPGGDSGIPSDDAGTGADAPVADGGGAAAFVGSWSRTGTDEVTCPSKTTDVALGGASVIVLGSTSGTLVETLPGGCVLDYTVAGNVATAAPGEPCNTTTEAGVAAVITTTTHTLTLSASGTTLTEAASDAIDFALADGGTEDCTEQSSGTFTKE